MRLAAAICAVLLLAACNDRIAGVHLQSRNENPVPLTSEPSHHLVLTNPYVRVFRVEAAPNASTLVHRHDNDYFWVSLGPSDITNNVTCKPPVHAQLADGDVRFVAGGFAHSVTNNSRQPFRNFTVELLQHGSRTLNPSEDEHEMTLMNGGSIERLLVRDGVRVSEIELKPGASFSRHNPGPRLMVFLSANCFLDNPPRTMSTKADVIWRCADSPLPSGNQPTVWNPAAVGSETFNNNSHQPARLLILDF